LILFYPLQSSHYYDANDPDYLRNYSTGALNWQVGDMHSSFPPLNPPQSTATNDFQFLSQSPRQKNPWDKEDVSHSSMDGFNQSLILNQTSSKMKTSTIPSPTGSTGSNYSRAPALTYRYPNGDTWSFYGTNGTPSGGYGSNGNLLHTGYSLVDPRQVPVNPYYMYDYARGQTPKSAELFDPNAPLKSINEKQKLRPSSHHSLEIDKNMNMHSFPRSPSHESFFARNLFYQGNKTGAPRSPLSEGENLPSDQATETHNTNTANMQHILEIYDFPQERSDMEFVLNEVKKSGATIKWLNEITVIAIYKTANSAKEALLKMPSHHLFMLRPWKLPVGGNNAANQHTIE